MIVELRATRFSTLVQVLETDTQFECAVAKPRRIPTTSAGLNENSPTSGRRRQTTSLQMVCTRRGQLP
jgi:hypothetical protein